MKELVKKEFKLCVHPTSYFFLAFCLFVFIPNYPYEVMFFFSGLSVFFVCLTARENGDFAATCALPVKKSDAAAARIATMSFFQIALVLLACIATAVKELALPADMQVNMAGSTANIAFIGYGLLLCGLFNIAFFPKYFADPNRVGIPFLIASALEFAIIAALTTCRFAVPFFRDVLCAPDPLFIAAKSAVLAIGLCAYILCTLLAVRVSEKRFERVDL